MYLLKGILKVLGRLFTLKSWSTLMRSPFPLPPLYSRNFITNRGSAPAYHVFQLSHVRVDPFTLLAPLILPVSTGSHSSDLGAQGDPQDTLSPWQSPPVWVDNEEPQQGLWPHKPTTSPWIRNYRLIWPIVRWFDAFHEELSVPIDVQHTKIPHESILKLEIYKSNDL